MADWSEVLLNTVKDTFLFMHGIILGILQFLVPRKPKSLKGEVMLVMEVLVKFIYNWNDLHILFPEGYRRVQWNRSRNSATTGSV